MKDSSKLWILLALALALLLLVLGKGLNADNYQYFLSRRSPKVAAIILAAVAIALSSMAFQTITSNRILTPSIMGFDSLYMLTQVVIVYLFGRFSALSLNPYLNFLVCAGLMMLFATALFRFYFSSAKRNLMVLLLLGVILSQMFSNAASMLAVMLDPNDYSAVQANLFASFNQVNQHLILLASPLIALSAWLLFKLNNQLNVLWLDRDNAISLGIDVNGLSQRVLLLSSLLIAIATALVGPVLFFGLLVTNLTREWFTGYQHRLLFGACVLISIVALLLGQVLVEQLFQFQTTLSVVINFIGGMYFLHMLIAKRIV